MQPPSGRELAHSQKWLRITILVIGTLVFLCFLGLSPLLRGLTRRDRESAVPRIGIATVAEIVPLRIEENSKPISAQALVRFQNQLLPAAESFGTSRMKVGSPVQITYRIGQSGRIYVDRAEPLPEPKTNTK